MLFENKEIKHIIRSLTENIESAFMQCDGTGVSEFYTESGMLLPAGSDFVKGKQEIKEFWQGAMNSGIKTLKLDLVELEQRDDTVIEMSHYVLKDEDDKVVDTGKGIAIWKLENDTWKIHRDIWNSSVA